VKAYEALIFDLFDTLLLFDRERLPLVQVNGRELRSTSLSAYEVVSSAYRYISFPDFYHAFVSSFEEVASLRSIDHREIPAAERFRILFERLGIERTPLSSGLLERALLAHMDSLSKAMVLPPESQQVLKWARGQYRLGLISNFDHHPTVYRLLGGYGIGSFFDEIVVSSEVGWRKPREEIFHVAFNRLGIQASQALFTGDSPGIDVVGAKQVGMDVAWLNREGEALGEGIPEPNVTIANLVELIAFLETGARDKEAV